MYQSFSLTTGKTGDISYLRFEPADASAIPTVICLHGLASRKESQLSVCLAFAKKGFRAVAFDLALHGERSGAAKRDLLLVQNYSQTMFQIIRQSTADISLMIDHLGVERAAIHGVSLGGIVAFAALIGEERLTVATLAMASPDWLGLFEFHGGGNSTHPLYSILQAASPLTLHHKIPPKALLMLHGDQDEVIDIAGVRKIYKALAPYYAETPERLELIVHEGQGHVYTDEMLQRSIAWIERFL